MRRSASASLPDLAPFPTMDMQRFLSRKIVDMPRSGIREFFDLCAGSKDIISLGVG